MYLSAYLLGVESLCYCILPGVFDILRRKNSTSNQSIAIVVSPLIALMKDQVREMKEKGVSAVYVGGVNDEVETKVCNGEYQLVYLSPEALLTNETWRDMLGSDVYQQNLVALVVDEAHCVKKWGESFRKEFSRLGDARCLIPSTVRVMALTATATKSTRTAVQKTLRMICPVLVTTSPNKPNIKYIVHSTEIPLEEFFFPLVEEMKRKRVRMERTIVFCRTYKYCSSIYMFMASLLGKEMMEPVGTCRDLPQYRLLDMFSACTHETVKESILRSIVDRKSTLRVVVATIAFGMGLNCPNIKRIIHWVPSSDLESYLQETGRAGRDGTAAEATLHYTNVDLGQIDDKAMKEYCNSKDTCRRTLIMKEFESMENYGVNPLCSCCDVCEKRCTCNLCE